MEKTCLNIKFQKSIWKLWTYINTNNAKVQIDYILMNKNGHTPCAYAGLWCKLPKTHTMIGPCLTKEILAINIQSHSENKFDALQEISKTLTPNDEYENFFNAHMKTVVECIPTKLRAKRWIPWETLTVQTKRDNVKTVYLYNKSHFPMPTLRKLRRHKVNKLTHNKSNK